MLPSIREHHISCINSCQFLFTSFMIVGEKFTGKFRAEISDRVPKGTSSIFGLNDYNRKNSILF